MTNKNLKTVQFELHRNESTWYMLSAHYKGYGFALEITDLETEEVVFSKFLKTKDINYCGNYLRKAAKNNFGATVA